MPIIVPKGLPAYDTLREENVFVMHKGRAETQDIRPLEIAIVNLMPRKEITETQLIRMLANTPLQVNLKLLTMDSHESKNTKREHLENFYDTYEGIKNKRFDGMIITGAPVEFLPFEEVDYWDELTDIMDYSLDNVFSVMHICWGAQAGLYHHYGIAKEILPEKIFGVFSHVVLDKKSELMRGFDDVFYVPHSRHTQSSPEEIESRKELNVLAKSDKAGMHIIATHDNRQIFVQGHSEYDRDTLKWEYDRDIAKGMNMAVPENYFKDDDPAKGVEIKWKGHANLLFANWLNYVYQETPYDLNRLDELQEVRRELHDI